MNETIIKFLKSLDIDFEKVNSLEDSRIKSKGDVNYILSRHAMFKPKDAKKVSIADVVGYEYRYMNLDTNIFNNLSHFFDRNGDGYHRRSVSMLDIPQSEIMTQLDYSFQREPICLTEVDKGIYNVGNNGFHRFHVIKTHFLDELSKINPENKVAIKKLKEKYSFNATVSELDFVKSYSSFLLSLLDRNLKLQSHYNEDYELTEKTCLISDYDFDEIVLTNDQLIELVNEKIKQFYKTASKSEKDRFNEIVKTASKFETFKEYFNVSLKESQKGEREWN